MKDSNKDLPEWLTDLDPNIYFSDNFVVLDFETTNIDKGHWRNENNTIILACWCKIERGRVTRKHVFGGEFDLSSLVDDCNNCDFIVAHNAQFELGWLSRCGYDVASRPVFCTQIAEYVIAGNRGWRVGLDASLERRGFKKKDSLVSQLIKGGVCPSDIPKSWLESYCYDDIEGAYALFLDQRQTLQELGLLNVFYCRCLLTAPLADISTRGMYLDESKVDELYVSHNKELAVLEKKLDDMTGGINPKSAKQMREFLYETMKFEVAKDYRGEPLKTKSGELSTSSSALAALKCKNKKQREFIDLRNKIVKLRDAVSKYLRHFYNCIQETDDSLLYGNFNQTITQTHRLSSTGSKYSVQFQNIDNRFKPAITVRNKDWWFCETDYSQLEYRCAVDMAEDETGLQDIIEGVDAHAYTANIIFEKEWQRAGEEENNKALKEIRRSAKAFTFKPLYGGTSGTKKQKAYYKAFKEKHSGITAWQDNNKAEVLRHGSLRIPSGLRFYWPDTKVENSGYVKNTASICNYPVQSFATADIVPIGVAFAWHRIRRAGLQSFIVNTVHDSILSEVHPDEVEIYNNITKQAMIGDVLSTLNKLYNYDFTTPLEVEAEYTKNWGDTSNQLEVKDEQ